MSQDLTPVSVPRPLARAGLDAVPALFAEAGDRAANRFIEFFTANIRNKHTRAAYALAVRRFCGWCEGLGLRLGDIAPVHVAAYVEQLGQELAKPSVKQHLAAVRMLFDWLVTGQVVPHNPATSVRGPKYVVRKGKTPVLTGDEARSLFEAIDAQIEAKRKKGRPAVAELRDRALIGVMVYSFARVGAVLGMDVDDYYQHGKRWWIRLHEKGGKHHEVPAHHKLEEYLDAYLAAAGLAGRKGEPLFRRLDRKRQLSGRRLTAREALAVIKRRGRRAELGDGLCCHTFRATGITNYLENGGTIDVNQPYYLLPPSYPGWPLRGTTPRPPGRYAIILAQPVRSARPNPSPTRTRHG